MSRDIADPWRLFLDDIDQATVAPLVLHCIGGFAVSVHYGLDRPTGDIDVVEVVPHNLKSWLQDTAGRGSALHRKHRIHFQIVTVAELPYSYEDRLTEIGAGQFKQLQLFVPDAYDLALSKLARNLEVDFEDVKHLAHSQNLDLAILEERYREELRPQITGLTERHDQTLRLWIEAISEERRG